MDAVLNWLWQGTVVAAAAFVMLLALERARANVRYVMCWAALLVVVTLPALPSVPLARVSTDTFRIPQSDALVSLPDTWWTSSLVLLAAWIVWATVHLMKFAVAIAATRRARIHSRPFPSNEESNLRYWVLMRSTGRRATLVVSEAAASAAVLGWGAPMIAVSPSLLKTLDANELDRVLIHEWSHVQRRDDVVNILQVMNRAIFGWHPAVWWIDRRLHVEREMACDERTVAITGSAKTYAECLVKLASLRSTQRTLQGAPAVLRSAGLTRRITTIVSSRPAIAPRRARAIAGASVTSLCLMSLELGGLKLVEATVHALPIVSPRTLSTTANRATPIAVPVSSLNAKTDHSFHTASTVRLTARSRTEHRPSQQPGVASAAAETPEGDGGQQMDSAVSPERNPEPVQIPVFGTAAQVPPERPDTTAEESPAPWTAAADGGVAIGRKSRDAGIATAGFFTRFAHRVAGSF